MSSLKSFARIGQMSVRQMSSKGEVHPGYARLKEIQKLYQKDDGLPVHLKRGFRDKALLYTTFGLIGVGLVECARFFYEFAQK